jgi:transposase-like protein
MIRSGASGSDISRRYGIAPRVLRRWKQDVAAAKELGFVTVQIADGATPAAERAMP